MTEARTSLHWVNYPSQFDIDALAQGLDEVSGGTIHLREIDTGSEDRVFVISDRELTEDEADRVFHDDADDDAEDIEATGPVSET